MDRLDEIRARFEEAKADNASGYMIPTADVEYLLAEIERLKHANRIAAAAWDNSALNFSEAQMERWKARAEKAEAERDTYKVALQNMRFAYVNKDIPPHQFEVEASKETDALIGKLKGA
ncbi:hypothetical protein [Oscillibacter sp.]|uniref:hypothetical protein n=1 Tax=Oscillibacter sp. TaxID=1945593 RepID=UPI0028A1650C|nr:hypothetical protein [Oscillibacter sp.]